MVRAQGRTECTTLLPPLVSHSLPHSLAVEGPHQCDKIIPGLRISWYCTGQGARVCLEKQGTELVRRHDSRRYNSKRFI